MVLIALATLAGATLQASAGFGFALVLAPALFAKYEPSSAIFTVLVLSGCLNMLILGSERRQIHARVNELFIVATFALPGLVVGLVIVAEVSKPALQVVVGVCVVLAALQRASRWNVAAQLPTTRLRAGTGLACGVLTTTTGTNGPPMVLMLQRTGATPTELRDTMASLLLGLDIVGIGAILLSGAELDLPSSGFMALLIALTATGHAIGKRLFQRLRPEVFQAVALGIVTAAGVASLAAGFSG